MCQSIGAHLQESPVGCFGWGAETLVDGFDHERAREGALARDERVELGFARAVAEGVLGMVLEPVLEVGDALLLGLAQVSRDARDDGRREIGVPRVEVVEGARDDGGAGQRAPSVGLCHVLHVVRAPRHPLEEREKVFQSRKEEGSTDEGVSRGA